MRCGFHKIWPHQPAVTLTFDLQNLIRPSVRVVNILCTFHQDCSSHSWDIMVTMFVHAKKCGSWQPINIMPYQTLLYGEAMIYFLHQISSTTQQSSTQPHNRKWNAHLHHYYWLTCQTQHKILCISYRYFTRWHLIFDDCDYSSTSQ